MSTLLVCLAVWLGLNVAFVALRLYVTSDRKSQSETFPVGHTLFN